MSKQEQILKAARAWVDASIAVAPVQAFEGDRVGGLEEEVDEKREEFERLLDTALGPPLTALGRAERNEREINERLDVIQCVVDVCSKDHRVGHQSGGPGTAVRSTTTFHSDRRRTSTPE